MPEDLKEKQSASLVVTGALLVVTKKLLETSALLQCLLLHRPSSMSQEIIDFSDQRVALQTDVFKASWASAPSVYGLYIYSESQIEIILNLF